MIVHLSKTRRVTVSTYDAASAAIRKAWGNRGAQAFYGDPYAGLIFSGTNSATPRAHVSFNGRVWEGGDRFFDGAKEIAR